MRKWIPDLFVGICWFFLMNVLILAGNQTLAQGTIQGTVVDSSTSEPLPGVNVAIQSLSKGGATDVNGNYQITSVPSGTYTLRVSFIGYKTKKRQVKVSNDETIVNIKLQPSNLQLDEMVVTALGVESSERSLGYSTQEIEAEDLTINRSTNVLDAFHGKVAGAEVTSTSGTIGSSTRIVLRGANSLSGDNQPLFIVDGVYIDNSNFNAPNNSSNSADYGNAAMDINPDDIESINVLKGPSASALYGSKASNGAIIITTKDGSSNTNGLQVSVNLNTKFNRPWILPDLQDQYGQGLNGEYEYVDGRGGGVNDATGRSWGPPLDGQLIPQWWSEGEPVPWVSHPGNTKNFFNTGITSANNIAIAGNYDKTNYRVSVTKTDQKGMFPNVSADKANFQASIGAQLSEDFRIEARSAYTNYIARNLPNVGYSYPGNPIEFLYAFHGRQLDMNKLRNYKNPDGSPRNFLETFYDNYFWVMNENTKRQERNRIMGGMNVEYNFNEWLSATGRIGVDWYQERRNKRIAYGSFTDNDGYYEEFVRYVSDRNYNFMLNAVKDINEDFNIDMRIGVEHTENQYDLNGASTNSLVVPGIYSLTNTAVRPNVQDFTSIKKVNSIFGTAKLGFKNYVYLNLTGRNDWSSTLPKNNNSYFYPSASLSFVFTDALDFGSEWLSFGKIRGSWTKVGNDTDPYQLQTNYNSTDAILGEIPSYQISSTLANSNLKPEQTESWEIGTQLSFFRERLNLDFTYYNSTTRDQILAVPISEASGFQYQTLNAGAIQNNGIEISLGGTPIKKSNFQWDLNVNFTKNHNEVIRLISGVDSYVISDQGRDITIEARPGEEFGALYGYGFKRDDQGNIVVNNRGIPITDTNKLINFGSYQPDWQSGISTNLSYENFTFGAVLDIKYGGTMSSETYMWGRVGGTTKHTLKGREKPFIFDGGEWANGAVKEDGIPNDIPVDAEAFNQFFYGNAEAHIFDASYVKLRQLQLTYTLPASILEKLQQVKNIHLSLTANNVWMIHKNVPLINPEAALSNQTSAQGIESMSAPHARSFGFSINLQF